MAEEKKLGPNVTYVKQEGQPESMEAYGVRFKAGESVNLVERLGEKRGQDAIKKLAGNQYFKVDGGLDHQAEKKKRDEAEKKQAEAEQKDREKADEEARKQAGQYSPPGSPGQGHGPPEHANNPERGEPKSAAAKRAEEEYKGPEKEGLENQPPPRRRSPQE